MTLEEERLMKFFAIAAVIVVGLALAFGDGGSTTTSAQTDSRQQQIVNRVDGYLQKGLSAELHEALSEKAHASADWFKGLEAHLADATQ
jgi:hypothetical protein